MLAEDWPRWYAVIPLCVSVAYGMLRVNYSHYTKLDMRNAGLQDEVWELRRLVSDRDDHKRIADALTDEHAHAIKNLFHRQFSSEQEFQDWKIEEAAWTVALINKMYHLKCTKQEIHSVETFGGFEFIAFHDNWNWSNAKSLLHFRLNRLAEVSSSRAQMARESISKSTERRQ